MPLETEVSFGSESQFFAGLSGDISTGGIFISTYRVVPIGCKVQIDFELPNGRVSAKGTVRWHREASEGGTPGVGVSFEQMSPEHEALVRAFCEHRAPLYYDVDE